MPDLMAGFARTYAVLLGGRRVGVIRRRDAYTRFSFDSEYLQDPERPILGLRFEEDLSRSAAATQRLPAWFSNLLPEGRLREWVAQEAHATTTSEIDLLARLGHDLPGAVTVREVDDGGDSLDDEEPSVAHALEPDAGFRFSLAGVSLKFSMVQTGDRRLVLPASGMGGDWIVKLPDAIHPAVPANEFAMMSLARMVGIEVPEIRLVHRDALPDLPDSAWPNSESIAYAISRFDRDDQRRPIHIEDLAQVRGIYPERKYAGSFETVGGLIFRGHDIESLREFARRLAFVICIGNGDAHLKNWSLIYRDPRRPTLSPVYDLVSTFLYSRAAGHVEDLGLSLGRSKAFASATQGVFARLESRLGADSAGLAAVAAETAQRLLSLADRIVDLVGDEQVGREIESHVREHARTLGDSTISRRPR